MRSQIMMAGLALAGCALFVGQMNTEAVAARGSGGAVAPDVIVGSLPDITKYGAVGGIAAYAVGTTSCNIGNDFLLWEGNNNNHPTIGQNMYRVEQLDNGCTRIEHIGMSGNTSRSATRSIVADSLPGKIISVTLLHEPLHGVHHIKSGLPHYELPGKVDLLNPQDDGDTKPFPNYRTAFLDLIKKLPDPRVGGQWETASPEPQRS